MRYIEQLYNIQNPSFNSIIELNASLVPLQYRSRPWQYPGLNHGTAVLTTEEQCNAYIAAYGNMHQGKINEVLDEIKINDFANTDLQIIDWGCGQGLATICLFDFFNKHNLSLDLVKKVVLIEPSEVARDRAKTHVNAYLRDEDKIVVIGKYIDDVKVDDIVSDEPVTLHLFSNILDIPSIDLLRLANCIKTNLKGLHYFFCWGPLNQGNNRIDSFWSYFNEADSVFFNTHNKQEYNAEGKLIKTYSYTAKNRVFKVNGDECELIFVDYYQPKQFHAAYQLDAVCKALKSVDKNKLDGLHKNISDFEVQTPFDIGASIYEDVHPILAVLNNIITRGLPTKASPFLESAFADLGNQLLEDRLGGIAYDINGLNGEDLFLAMHLIDPRWQKSFDSSWTNVLQLVLSPVAVARLEKTILEALMTRVLNISATRWKVLVKEHDVPCAALAFEELREMFKHITQLSAEYSDLKFPEVELTIVSTKEFAQSSLHLNHRVLVGEYHSNAEYDMVIDFAMLRRNGLEDIDFTDYKCKNKCYFNVRSAHHHRNDRQIYTSDRILYKQIATQNNQGRYEDIEDNVKHLRYFLRMLFRKQDFRPGQIPILNRALQYKSVIGLLPTGGGKSLIYQIAAMLQPGVTLVIDPLRSLMKDQYDGLIGAGIDCCSYINSSIEVPEAIKAKGAKEIQDYRIKERERRSKCLEQSEFLFMFLSPERLSILNFRERLKNMQETGVYFAYGVIDEVHCVSEWGHDFRFSYLHLGRNLYRYVLPKPKEGDEKENHIPLFGLTATASFDVLADVERELSGNGAFPLDAETVVREGDTNRFEIQYKIEPVPVSFTLKQADGTVKPNKWAIFDSKKDFLDSLISQMPFYLNELLTEQSIQTITDGYTTGPRADGRELKSLQTDIPSDFLSAQDVYDYGGIVFCPHKDHTGVAVFTNQFELTTKHPNAKIGTFVGSDDGIALHHVEESFKNLELFRDNKLSLMIATKAFGMGIIYKWYDANDIEEIAQKKGIPVEDFEICDETSDLVKLKCKQCGDSCKRFENNCCSFACNHCDKPQKYESFKSVCAPKCEYYDTCELAKVPTVDKWSRYEHLSVYKERYPFITCENYEFLNADYETVMFFYNNNFKGENHEKLKMHQLLSKLSMKVTVGGQNEDEKTIHGFLATLQSVRVGTKVISYIPYTKGEYDDIAKAIYRMCCIDLIDDFTQDYNSKCFRIVSYKKSDGQYYAALEKYLRRYYTVERAAELVSEVPSYKGENEIHKCLGFLTHFIYDKIAVKRKRAIDDMFAFCVHGVDANKDWKAINEELKDELYFYFNSKYARREYRTERGEQFSLLVDTDEGKRSSWETVLKFMQVVDNQWISKNSEAGSTQNDNAKHLYGAVRLIRRDAKEINPTIDLLGAFCLMFLGTNNNHLLQKELEDLYISGMKEFYRQNDRILFWEHIFEVFNNNPNVSAYFANNGGLLKSAAMLEIHKYELSNIKNNYIK